MRIEYFQAVRAVRQNPRSAQAWVMLGNCLLRQGEHERARECFTRALSRDPNLRVAYYALALVDLPPYTGPKSWCYSL